LFKFSTGFILLMDGIKCWLNTPSQVLTEAPALHSLIIQEQNDAAQILEFLFRTHRDLRKLIIKSCGLGEDGTALLANIVDSYPDLEVLSLKGCSPLASAGYVLISRLKKLTELNLSFCEVNYVYVNFWRPMFAYMNACRRTPLEIYFVYLGKQEIYCLFKTCFIISVLFSTKWHLFRDFIIFCSSNTFFTKHVLIFKYPPW
jgi:hypothetical protein